MTGKAEDVNDVFNVGAKMFGTMREDFQAVLDHAGHGRKVRAIPAGPIILALKILEKLKLSPVYEWVYETAAVDSWVSIEKAERVLGVPPQIFKQGSADQELRLVCRASVAVPADLRHLPPNALEAGSDRPRQEILLDAASVRLLRIDQRHVARDRIDHRLFAARHLSSHQGGRGHRGGRL